MIVFPTIKSCYIHIPKTGGTSITRCLQSYTSPMFRSDDPQIEGPGHQGTWHVNGKQHATYSQTIRSMSQENIDTISNYSFFCVMRNPYDWFFSIYDEFYRFKKNMSLECFLDYIHNETIEGIASKIQSDYISCIPLARLTIIPFSNLRNELFLFLSNKGVADVQLEHMLNRGNRRKMERREAKNNPKFISVCDSYLRRDIEFLMSNKPELI